MRVVLWSILKPFAKSLILKAPIRSSVLRNAKADMLQDCYCIFHEKFDEYMPEQKPPTVYFYHYFQGVVYQYSYKVNHMTQHEFQVHKKIKKANYLYSVGGENLPMDILSEKTNLSRKTIQHNQFVSWRQYPVPIEILSYTPSQEEPIVDLVLREELRITILTAMHASLSSKQINLLLVYLNVDGKKCLSYKRLAELFCVPLRSIREELYVAIEILRKELIKTRYFEEYDNLARIGRICDE